MSQKKQAPETTETYRHFIKMFVDEIRVSIFFGRSILFCFLSIKRRCNGTGKDRNAQKSRRADTLRDFLCLDVAA